MFGSLDVSLSSVPLEYALASAFLGALIALYGARRLRRADAKGPINGTQPVPKIKGKWPGNIDILLELIYSESSDYPTEGISRWCKEYGPTFDMGILWSHQIVSADPVVSRAVLQDLDSFEKSEKWHRMVHTFLGDGIFAVDGPLWERHRATARPFFSRSRVADVQLLERHVDTLLEGLQRQAARSGALDMQAAFKALTLDITTDFLFGVTTSSLADAFRDKSGDAPEASQPSFAAAFEEISAIITKRVRIGASWYKYFEPFGDKTLRPKAVIDAFVDPVLATAWTRHEQLGTTDKSSLKDNPDYKFIDHLINTATGEDRELVKDELLNFLLAGRDTTASLLTFCLYILTVNPDVTRRLKAEISDAFGSDPIQSTDSLKQLTYLRAVIDETLRLFPPVPFNIRRSINPVTLPSAEGPLLMPGRTSITFVPFIFHRDREIWGDDCEEFRPERWISGEARDPKRTNAYVPFSAGPRFFRARARNATEGITTTNPLEPRTSADKKEAG
ncbi:hypothetical protein FRC00_001119 [Tulasnella sp. 408]|nr:hypothetical protein FRC00_001119 [Tulasnella sp. 408]